ncbi:MAG: ATP-binding protein [Negativicutes bacterium]|nr:ATP-binding protein [Negativicutes bacterium]
MKLAITCGLPLSGKSTLCRTMKDHRGYTIVCPDTIRLALHGNQFIGVAEPFVWAIAQTMVRALLKDGHDVIVDATNTTRERRRMWKQIAKEFGILLRIYRVNTDYHVCLARNAELNRLDSSVIARMYDQWEDPADDEGDLIVIDNTRTPLSAPYMP